MFPLKETFRLVNKAQVGDKLVWGVCVCVCVLLKSTGFHSGLLEGMDKEGKANHKSEWGMGMVFPG